MVRRLLFDMETNGLLDALDCIHCIVTIDMDSGEISRYGPNAESITDGLSSLSSADLLVGHNINGFDIPAIKKVVPSWTHKAVIRDTLVISRLIWPTLKDYDAEISAKIPGWPKELMGRHSLKAWGWRLGIHKGDYAEHSDFKEYSPEMMDYCVQDTKVTLALWNKLSDMPMPADSAIELEQDFFLCIDSMMRAGFLFDRQRADELAAVLQKERAKVTADIMEACPSFIDVYLTPKKMIRREKVVPFNPNSRQHIARHLIERRGWKPTVFTDGGQPQIDESILSKLEWPECRLFERALLIGKRLGQLCEGGQNLVGCVKADGRIHGYVNHNGTVTSRCTHSHPNMGQVPGVQSEYGSQFRALFRAGTGKRLVGVDAASLELRCLAHYLTRYDGGKFQQELLTGDIHSANQKACGLETRAQAKTFIYALLYGAGDAKIGAIVGGGEAQGKKMKQRYFAAMPAFGALRADIEAAVKSSRRLRGIDGRYHSVRSAHSALNMLLQSAGAVLMKQATVLACERIASEFPPTAWAMVAHVHDEMQFEVDESIADRVASIAAQSVEDAGSVLNFRCPMKGEAKIGNNWYETH